MLNLFFKYLIRTGKTLRYVRYTRICGATRFQVPRCCILFYIYSVVKGCETDNLQSPVDPVWYSNPEQRAGTLVTFRLSNARIPRDRETVPGAIR